MNSELNAYSLFRAHRAAAQQQFYIIDGRAVRINYAHLNAMKLYQLNHLPQSPVLNAIENNVWREKGAASAPAWPQRIYFNYDYPTPLIRL